MSEGTEDRTDAGAPPAAESAPGVNRRRFLKLATGAALAAGAAPALVSAASATSVPSRSVPSRIHPRKTGTINILVAAQTQAPQAQTQLMNRAKQMFESHQSGWTMTWDTYASAGEELTKIATSAAAHQGPDIFEVGLVPSAYGTGAFEVVTKDMWNELGGKTSFLQGQFGYAGPDPDHLIGIPENANPLGGMLYNKSYFHKAGIRNPPTTWNEFVHYAKEMTDANSNRWGATLDPADGFDPWHHVWLFASQMGGNLISPDGKTAQLDSDIAVEAAAFWLDWMGKFGIASHQNATFAAADMYKYFGAGDAAMAAMVGAGAISSLKTSAVANQYEWAVDPLVPYGDSKMPAGGKAVAGFSGGQFLCLFKYSPNQQQALDLVKVMLSPEIQHDFFTLYAQMPVKLDVFKKYPDTKKHPWDVLYDIQERAISLPFITSWGELETLVGQVVNQMSTQIATGNGYKVSDLRSALRAANIKLQAQLNGG